MQLKEIEYIWKDRKRIFGMPISFTRYSLCEDRIFLETGLLNMRQEEVILYRVLDISLQIRLTQRIFGVGTVILHSSDRSLPVLELKHIKHPREVKELLHQQVEQMKISRRLRVGEILDNENDDCIHEDDVMDELL